MLYSASLAPHLAAVPLRRRLIIGYLLTDQAYAVSIVRWTKEADDEAAGGPPAPGLDHKVPFYFGAALMLWGNWQVCTIVGVFVGSALPDSLPLDFAVPLVFLVLLVPAITSRPSAVAAIVGGGVALAVGRGRREPPERAVRRAGRHRRRRGRGVVPRPRRTSRPHAARARPRAVAP